VSQGSQTVREQTVDQSDVLLAKRKTQLNLNETRQQTATASWSEVLQAIDEDQTIDPNLKAVLHWIREDNHYLVVALESYNKTKDLV
jgi:2-hydroxy-3-keto-5-methylthiopentenyl-1-phosphate phosphatase